MTTIKLRILHVLCYIYLNTIIYKPDTNIFQFFQRSKKRTERLGDLTGSTLPISGEAKRSSVDLSLCPTSLDAL